MKKFNVWWLKYRSAAASGVIGLIRGLAFAHLKARWPDLGDLPTCVAALAAIAAGLYAARTFEVQKQQLLEAKKNQDSSNRLLAYQEHAAARAFAGKVLCDPMVVKTGNVEAPALFA